MAEISKISATLAPMINGDRGAGSAGPLVNALRLLFFLLVRHTGGRLGDIDRIGAGKAVFEPLLERLFELALVSLVPLALGLFVDLMLRDGFVRNSHENSPYRRRLRRLSQTTPRIERRSPVSPFRCGKYNQDHAHHDLHRGLAAGGPPQAATRVLRLCRGRLLLAGDTARQPRRPRAHQAAPARARRRVATKSRHHHSRREGLASAGARAHRALRDAARRRGDSGLPGGAGGWDSIHALDHVDLLDRGRGAGGRQAVLVPALRDEGPRLYSRPDRARRRSEMQRARAHARSAGAGSAP